MNQPVDIVIIGAGMVGLSCAIACIDAGFRVAVIDANEAPGIAAEAAPALRVSALSRASVQAFSRLGVWQHVPAQRQGLYDKMEVWENDTLGRIHFDAADLAIDALGTIVENQQVRTALVAALTEHDQAQLLWQTRVERLSVSDRGVWLLTEDGRDLQAALVVGADGAQSWVREQLAMPLTRWDYDHCAIVTTIQCELPHQSTAYQAFSPSGPLALLPLWQSNQCSIVWSQPPERAKALLALDDTEFAKAVTIASNQRLGMLKPVAERQGWPLTMRYSRDFVAYRVALMGDAAHTIHPLAGQGANLGILDALSLADVLASAREQGLDIGGARVLARYARWRKAEAVKMIGAMEGFKQLFTPTLPPFKLLRSTGLSLVDKISPLKQKLIRYAAGLDGDLPVLAKGAQWLAMR